jgi:uncharacterized protein YchJ
MFNKKELRELTKEIKQLRLLIEKTIDEDKKQTAIMNAEIIKQGTKEAIEETSEFNVEDSNDV